MLRMSKNIYIFIFIIFLSSCSTGKDLISSNEIKPGMTKVEVEWILSTKAMIYQAALPLGYREYFSDLKKEILSDEHRQVYYIYKNVFTPVKCGILLCKLGDGILEKTFYDYKDAREFIKGKEDIKVKPKKTITIESNGQSNEVNTADITKLQSLIKDFESGKISEEEFNKSKSEIIK